MVFKHGLILTLRDAWAFLITTRKSPSQVASTEIIARYILSKQHYNRDKESPDYEKIKYNAFMPLKDASVNRISGINDKLIWDLGSSVAKLRKKDLHGRADIGVIKLRQCGGEAKPEPPPFSHAVFYFNPAMENAEQKKIAEKLALKSGKLIKQPSSLPV